VFFVDACFLGYVVSIFAMFAYQVEANASVLVFSAHEARGRVLVNLCILRICESVSNKIYTAYHETAKPCL